jgi:hypothetical protein
VTAVFVYATKPHVPDYMINSTYRFVTDQLGSVRLSRMGKGRTTDYSTAE